MGRKRNKSICHEPLLSLTSITMTYLSPNSLNFTAHGHSKISFQNGMNCLQMLRMLNSVVHCLNSDGLFQKKIH